MEGANYIIKEQEFEALYQATSALERVIMPNVPIVDEYFAYDPLPWAIFVPGIRVVSNLIGTGTFLDIGCGIGTKVAYMNYLGWQSFGIDRQPTYIEEAKKIVPDASFELSDLFDVDEFSADLIYMYRPGVSDETEEKIERYVVERMKKGSYLFLPTRIPDDSLNLTHIELEIWRK